MKTVLPPARGEKLQIQADAGERLEFGFDVDSAQVDILGSDMILTLPDGGQVVLSGMAVSLFGENPPILVASAGPIDPNAFLSKVGLVQSVTGKEAAILTSLTPETKQGQQQKSEDFTKQAEQEFKYMEPPKQVVGQQTVTVAASSKDAGQGNKTLGKFNKGAEKIFKQFRSNEEEQAPTQDISRSTEVQAPAVQSKFNPDAGGEGGILTFSTDAQLLQVNATQTTDDSGLRTFIGGTGSAAATIDGSALSQIQQEFIDTSRINSDVTIVADNSTFVTETLLSRVLEYTPVVPTGFDLTEVVISGIPSNFTLKGQTPNAAGQYVLTSNELSGDVEKFTLQYDPTQFSNASADNIFQSFTINITSTAESAGVVAADSPPLTEQLVIPVAVKDTTADDYQYFANGVEGWVLDIKPTGNVILTGNGNNTITGGFTDDQITSGNGNDTINGGRGDDFIRSNKGDDIIDTGTGNNIVDAGDGVDTVTYANRAENVVVDLASTPNADGYLEISVGDSQTDQLLAVENITGGSGDDSLIGDANNNTFIGGAGDDTLIGAKGNDVLDGGADSDTVSYAYAAAFSSSGITVDLNTDTVTIASDDIDTIQNIENVIGTQYNDTLVGNAADNTLNGGDGDDVLSGGGGNDTFVGGAGTDTVQFLNQSSGVTVNLAAGTGTTLAGEQLQLSGIESLVGSNFNDTLTGDVEDNLFTSGLGSDVYDGSAGSDTLTYAGSASGLAVNLSTGIVTKAVGNDTLSNIETFVASGFNDNIIGGGTVQHIDGGAGIDTLSYGNLADLVTVNLTTGETTLNSDGSILQTFSNIENTTISDTGGTLVGNSGDNIFTGGSGVDIVDYSSSTGAVIANLTTGVAQDGLGGTDTFINIDGLIGSDFGDTLTGTAGNDTINGGAGDDMIVATTGNDTIDGGTGANTISYTGLGISITNIDYTTVASTGFVTITFDSGKVDLVRNVDIYRGTVGNDEVTGGGGNGGGGLASGGGGGSGSGGAGGGAFTVDGGAGSDTMTFASETNAVTVDLQTGTATGTFGTYNFENFENTTGGSDNDTLTGSTADNTIRGGAGDDTIIGTLGTDVLDGEAGNNTVDYSNLSVGLTISPTSATGTGTSDTLANFQTIIATNQGDTINDDASSTTYNTGGGDDIINVNTGTDIIDGGADIDTISFLSHASGVGLVADLSVRDGDNFFDITLGGETNKAKNIEVVEGTNQADTITGDNTANTLRGAGGDDTLDGGTGNDSLDGGSGVDTVTYAAATSGVSVNLASVDGDGFATATIGAETDTIKDVENLIGSNQGDTFTGNNAVNNLQGGLGDDVLDGGAGLDTIDGGVGGTDTATYVSLAQGVTVNGMTVTDNDSNIETLTNIEIVAGTNQGDQFIGTSGADVYQGLGGNDTFIGTNGADNLDGGANTDTIDYSNITESLNISLRTGATSGSLLGSQTLSNIENVVGGTNDDTIEGGVGANNLQGGGGNDTLSYANAGSAVTVNLTTSTATDDGGATDTISGFTNLTGSGYGDTLTGGTGGDTILAGGGDDVIFASTGDDTIDGEGGSNSLSYAATNTAISVDLGTVNGGGYATVTQGGKTDLIQNIQTLTGSSVADSLTGSSSAETLIGDAGADTLVGAGGNDTLDGGADTDTVDYTYASGGITADLGTLDGSGFAQVVVSGGGDTDNLIRVENITGSNQGDTFTGDSAVNTFLGQGGDDLFYGDAGDDTLDGGSGADTLNLSANSASVNVVLDSQSASYQTITSGFGSDTIRYIENITTGSGSDTIDARNDIGDNTIVAGGGNDLIYASAGNDSLDGGSGGYDTLRFNSATSAVTIDLSTVDGNGFASATYGANTTLLKNFFNIFSSAYDDVITGSSGNDVLYGVDGSDTISGGGGDDTIIEQQANYADSNNNILNGNDGDDTFYVNLADNTINGGNDTDILSYDNDGGTSDNLTVNVGAGTVTNGVYTDSFSNIETVRTSDGNDTLISDGTANRFEGNDGNDTFRGGGGNDLFFGGDGTDTANYIDASTSVNANLSTNSATDGDGGTDTFDSIESLTGSNHNDTLTGNTQNNTLLGGSGNDTLVGSAGNDTLNGGIGSNDVVDYTAQTGAITIDLTTNNATGSSINTDTFLGIEGIDTGSGDDIILADAGTFFANTIDLDLGAGTADTATISSGTVGTDASAIDSFLDNVEILNLLGTDTGGGNLAIDGDDVVGLTDGNNALRIDIGSSFGLTVAGGSYSVSSAAGGSGQTVYTFNSGATPVAQLDVYVT